MKEYYMIVVELIDSEFRTQCEFFFIDKGEALDKIEQLKKEEGEHLFSLTLHTVQKIV